MLILITDSRGKSIPDYPLEGYQEAVRRYPDQSGDNVILHFAVDKEIESAREFINVYGRDGMILESSILLTCKNTGSYYYYQVLRRKQNVEKRD